MKHKLLPITLLASVACVGIAFADSRPDLTVAVTKLARTLDPMGQNANVVERVGENIIENLIRYNWKTTGVQPGLATEWTMINDTTLELKIRDDVKCHDGTDFTAEDVEIMFGPERYGTEDAKGPGYELGKPFFNTFKEVKAIDGNKVQIVTNEPDPLLINRLSGWMGQVPCADAYLAAEGWDEWGQQVVGTGPYKLVSRNPGESDSLEVFDDYWGEQGAVKSITYKVVPETAARIAGLITGEFDIVTEIQPDHFKTITDNDGTDIGGGAIRNIRFMPYDTRHPALQDKRVRQALNLAIDRDLLIKAVFDGMSTVPNGFQMESFGDMYISDHNGAQFDPDKARMLLKEAGYDGEEISFRYLKDYYTGEVSTVQILEQMWADVGFNIKLELKENWTQIQEDEVAEGRGIINWSGTAYLNDPVGQVRRLFGPDGYFQVHSYWDGSAFNAASEGLMSADLNTRKATFAKLLAVWEDEAPAGYLYVLPMFYGKSKTFNWTASDTGLMDFRADNLSVN
jgi:peptide/nickel transport system substrate-binding protein